ncbi:Spo0E family sporulation regulatory protein-aspartic acid phosphatase [Domibacillus sp. A3M-37]
MVIKNLLKINNIRHLMIQAAQQHGLCNPETLRYSEKSE